VEVQDLVMKNENTQITALDVLDQVEVILQDVAELVETENRVDETLELTESIRLEQESINLIDRIRNTAGEITISLNCPSYPLLTGLVRFSSPEYLVLRGNNSDYFINLAQIVMLKSVDERAIFKLTQLEFDTTKMWLKNLLDESQYVTVFLADGSQHDGVVTRLNHDHIDLVNYNCANSKTSLLIPLDSITLIRKSNEN
jgi:hypothetical protein